MRIYRGPQKAGALVLAWSACNVTFSGSALLWRPVMRGVRLRDND